MRLASLLAALLTLAACKAEPPPEFTGPPSPALFEISSPDGAVEGWLFGTIHSLPDGVDWKTETLSATIAQADLLVVEVRNLDDGAAMAAAFAERARAEGQPDLSDKVPADRRDALRAIMDRHALTDETFAGLETWAAALALAQYGTFGDAANGADRALLRDAPRSRIIELEGAARQLDAFDRLPEAEQCDLLLAVIADMERARENPADNAADWYRGKIDGLADPASSALLADPELREALYSMRNRDWARKIEALLQRAPRPLVAVGAAHLSGDESLPALLAERGYSLRRIQ